MTYIPLRCDGCGGHFVGPPTLIGTPCLHRPRPAGANDIWPYDPDLPDGEPF